MYHNISQLLVHNGNIDKFEWLTCAAFQENDILIIIVFLIINLINHITDNHGLEIGLLVCGVWCVVIFRMDPDASLVFCMCCMQCTASPLISI
jgi:hypothetical protein